MNSPNNSPHKKNDGANTYVDPNISYFPEKEVDPKANYSKSHIPEDDFQSNPSKPKFLTKPFLHIRVWIHPPKPFYLKI